MDPGVLPQVAVCPRWNQDRHDAAIRTFPVITAKISCISGSLVDIGLRRLPLAFELNHHDTGADEEEDVRASGFERELVLEDCGVLLRQHVPDKDFIDLAL